MKLMQSLREIRSLKRLLEKKRKTGVHFKKAGGKNITPQTTRMEIVKLKGEIHNTENLKIIDDQ